MSDLEKCLRDIVAVRSFLRESLDRRPHRQFLAMLPVSMARLGKNLPLKILNVGFLAIPRPTGIITLKKRTLSPVAQHCLRIGA
jgi:hypothetical protein